MGKCRKSSCFFRFTALSIIILTVENLPVNAVPMQPGIASPDTKYALTPTVAESADSAGSADEIVGEANNSILLKINLCHQELTSSNASKPNATLDKKGSHKAAKIEDIRLPKSLKPVTYLIRLQPFINGNFAILGYIEITIEVLEATKNVTLHMADIVTKNDTIRLHPTDDLTGPGVRIMQHNYDKDREFYVAMLEQELTAGKQYVLIMEFEGLLNDKFNGFYRSQYTDERKRTKLLAATQFQPTDARRAFPCFDEPALKAKFEVFLARQTNMSAISNMPWIETTPMAGQHGWVWDHFNRTVPMSTYLLAFVISDFSHTYSTTSEDFLFRVWARDQAVGQANYSLDIGPDILTYFEDYFNLPYPLPKMDMVAIPSSGYDGLGSWGLVTGREEALLYDPAVSSASNKQRVAAVVSHELAHQWFGDLVTPSWWTDLWLNEGFASYLENLGVDAVEPTWNMLDQFVVNRLHKAFEVDGLESSHPLSLPALHADEITDRYDSVTRNKGASVVHMMSHFLGKITLKKGISRYLKHSLYSNAQQDDLWRFLTKQAHRDDSLPLNLTVKTIMDTWTLQKGYPVVTVTFKENGIAQLAQERFLMSANEASTDTHDYKWWIPITLTTEFHPNFNNTKPGLWMSDTDSTTLIGGLPHSNMWTIFNIQQAGFYRVNYDSKNWMMLVKQLGKDHKMIHVLNRAQLVDDSLNLARAGMLGYKVAMYVVSYLLRENQYIPWKSAFNNLEYLRNILIRTPAYGAFRLYMWSLMRSLYKRVGFTDNIEDSHLDQLKRAAVIDWACKLGSRDCGKTAILIFKDWMRSPSNKSIVAPNLKETVFCTAMRKGGENEWNFAWRQYKQSNVSTEKESLLRALGCTKEAWILAKYMEIAFTAGSGVRKQDASTVFAAVAGNEVGRELAWNFLRARLPDIVRFYGSAHPSLGTMIQSASATFDSRFMREDLIRFRAQYSDILRPLSRVIDQSIERTVNNEAWLSTHYPVIFKWFKDHGYNKSN